MLLRICYGKAKNFVTCGENLPFVEIMLCGEVITYTLFGISTQGKRCVLE